MFAIASAGRCLAHHGQVLLSKECLYFYQTKEGTRLGLKEELT